MVEELFFSVDVGVGKFFPTSKGKEWTRCDFKQPHCVEEAPWLVSSEPKWAEFISADFDEEGKASSSYICETCLEKVSRLYLVEKGGQTLLARPVFQVVLPEEEGDRLGLKRIHAVSDI